MYRYYTIFIFLCGLATGINAQPSRLADSLFAIADYELAAVEYERCVYRAETREEVHQALVSKAECYKRLGRYGRAADALGRCATDYGDYLQLALCRYLDRDFAAASAAAERCTMLCDSVAEDILLVQMLALNEQSLFDSAATVGLRLAELHRLATGDDISLLIDSVFRSTPRLKSETLCWYLSLIPGLGHAYAGEYGLGLAAFAMNAAVLAFGVWQVYAECYVTAWLGGAGLLSVTYPGAMRSAEHYVRKANYERVLSFNNSTRRSVMDALYRR